MLASTVTVGLLIWIERDVPEALRSKGRLLRIASISAAVLTSSFILWEWDDSIALGGRVLFKMQEWRTHELSWQIHNDEHSPKVGQPAPDFELSDPSGVHSARLSDSRGNRPVALVFGSYT